MYYVRTKEGDGYLYLGRGKLAGPEDATPYHHPSAAKLAIKHMEAKLAKNGLPARVFEYTPSRDGVAVRASDPFVQGRPSTPSRESDIHLVAQNNDVRILRHNGKVEVVVVKGTFPTMEKAQAFLEACCYLCG